MLEGSFWDKLYSLTLEPFVYAFESMDVYSFVLPFLYSSFLVQRYIANYSAVF